MTRKAPKSINLTKFVQIYPNCCKLLQLAQTCFKWVQMAPKDFKLFQMTMAFVNIVIVIVNIVWPFIKISQLLADEGLTLEYWSETLTFRRLTVYDDWRFELFRCFLFIQQFVSVWYSVWVQCWAIVECFELLQCPPPLFNWVFSPIK